LKKVYCDEESGEGKEERAAYLYKPGQIYLKLIKKKIDLSRFLRLLLGHVPQPPRDPGFRGFLRDEGDVAEIYKFS
jgi:hypothetical protein